MDGRQSTPEQPITRNSSTSNEQCGLDLKLGPLSEKNIDWGGFQQRPIDIIREDRYNPGKFYFNSRTTIMRWVTNQPVTALVGNVTQEDINVGYRDGPSDTAEFTLISDFVQYNQTKMAISDFQNACVRLYDFETDMVSTIVGFCNAYGRGRIPYVSWARFDNTTEKNSLDPQFSGILSIYLLEKWNKLLIMDNAYKLIIQHDFATQKTRLLNIDLFTKSPRPIQVIADQQENNIFINHAYGLTKYNLHTKMITLLFGSIDETLQGNRAIQLIPGPFTTAQTGALDTLRWLQQDRVLVSMGRKQNEALVMIDLEQEQVYSVCIGMCIVY